MQPTERDNDRWAEFESDIETIVRWHLLLGRPDLSVLDGGFAAGDAVVADTLSRLKEFAASSLFVGAVPPPTAAEQMDHYLRELERRELMILNLRVFADRPATLEELGQLLDVTRERIRQLEMKALTRLRSRLNGTDLVRLASTAHPDGRDVASLADVLRNAPSLGGVVTSAKQPLWRVLDRLDDSFEISDGWWCSPSVEEAKRRTRSNVKVQADGANFLSTTSLPEIGSEIWAREWLEYCGLISVGDHVLLGTGGIADRTELALAREGAPLPVEEIVSRIGTGRAVTSVKNALSTDVRFVRVDRNAWGLVSWGLESYQSIRELISTELARNDGSIRLSRLVDTLTMKFSISASSVVTYANSHPFVVNDGIVERASTTRVETRRSPLETRRVFRRDDSWLYRLEVNGEHLRGSGLTLPSGLIPALHSEYGVGKELTSDLGAQRLAWNGSQLTLGSIRRFLERAGASAGDCIFLVFGEPGTFDVEKMEIPVAIGVERALALVGRPKQDASRLHEVLAASVGVAPNVDPTQLARRLRERGDYDIVDCLRN